MYLVLYGDDMEIRSVEKINGEIKVKDNAVEWQDGALRELRCSFLIVDSEPEVSTITDALLSQDRSSEFLYISETERVRKDMDQLAIELTTLMTMP